MAEPGFQKLIKLPESMAFSLPSYLLDGELERTDGIFLLLRI